MTAELRRVDDLLAKDPSKPYFVSFSVTEIARVQITAEEGALQGSEPGRGRWIAAEVRIGTPALDSSHPLRDGSIDEADNGGRPLPLGDDVVVLRRAISLSFEEALRGARERYERVLSDRQILVAEDTGLDLAPSAPAVELRPGANLAGFDRPRWEAALRDASRVFAGSEVALDPAVTINAEAETHWFASSEGTRLRDGATRIRLAVTADTLAPDGTALAVLRAYDSATWDGLPKPKEVQAAAREAVEALSALVVAPELEPYQGPAILSGRAAAVFFHEIFGHRVEGQRLKRIADAQTFKTLVGQRILPEFLSVADDPTLAKLDAIDLRGHYRWDDEGVRAERVHLVKDGVLQGFLESRSPAGAAQRSNGHGRRQVGMGVAARQGNLLVTARDRLDDAELRTRLLARAREVGLPWALIIDDIDGGYTFTDRDIPNAFQVDVLQARRVWVDGRPDELVRGIDLIGTPLQTFSRILAAGATTEVFNGTCGAESGWVPVSAASPALLVSQIETQRKAKGQGKPPLLAPPPADLPGVSLLDAVVAEAVRTREALRLDGAPAPARVAVHVRDEEEFQAQAVFGTEEVERSARGRPTAVEVIVGDLTMDSGRFAAGGAVMVPEGVQHPRLVVEDSAVPIRRDLWLSADASYKAAVQRLNLKAAARRSQGGASPADWTLAPPVQHLDWTAAPAIDRARLRTLARTASARLRGIGDLRTGQVAAAAVQGREILVDTDGTRIVQPVGQSVVYAWADLVRADGVRLFDRLQWVARRDSELPPDAEIAAAVEAMGRSLAARAQEEVVDFYEGPVVFEDEAAADIFRYLVPSAVQGTPPEPSAGQSWKELNRQGPRLGRRLLPATWSVLDDPSAFPAGAAGSYAFDAQGVAPTPVRLVEDGYVRELLMTRVPRDDRTQSNGRARGGTGTQADARPTAWTVRPSALQSASEILRAAADLARGAGLDRYLVVRRMEQGWDGALPRPSHAVWRTLDGVESPVLLLEFQHADRSVLRDVVAAGGVMRQRRYLAPDGGWGRAGTTSGLAMVVTAPSVVLVDTLELHFPGAQEPPPLIPLPGWVEVNGKKESPRGK